VVTCLLQGGDCLHKVQLMPLHAKTPSTLASFKSRLILPFRYRLTQAVIEKRPLNGCVCVYYNTVSHKVAIGGSYKTDVAWSLPVCVCTCPFVSTVSPAKQLN